MKNWNTNYELLLLECNWTQWLFVAFSQDYAYMGYHLVSADLLLMELPSSRSCPCQWEQCGLLQDIQIGDRTIYWMRGRERQGGPLVWALPQLRIPTLHSRSAISWVLEVSCVGVEQLLQVPVRVSGWTISIRFHPSSLPAMVMLTV